MQDWRETDSEYEPCSVGKEEMEGLILKKSLFREDFLEETAFDLSLKGRGGFS